MAAPRKLQKFMLEEVLLSLDPSMRSSKMIRAEVLRRFKITVSRSYLAVCMNKWELNKAVAAAVRETAQKAVAQALAEVEVERLRSQVRVLNRTEDVLGRGLDVMDRILAALPPEMTDMKVFAVIADRVTALMSMASKVRTEMVMPAGEAKEIDPEKPGDENVINFAEMAEAMRNEAK